MLPESLNRTIEIEVVHQREEVQWRNRFHQRSQVGSVDVRFVVLPFSPYPQRGRENFFEGSLLYVVNTNSSNQSWISVTFTVENRPFITRALFTSKILFSSIPLTYNPFVRRWSPSTLKITLFKGWISFSQFFCVYSLWTVFVIKRYTCKGK